MALHRPPDARGGDGSPGIEEGVYTVERGATWGSSRERGLSDGRFGSLRITQPLPLCLLVPFTVHLLVVTTSHCTHG